MKRLLLLSLLLLLAACNTNKEDTKIIENDDIVEEENDELVSEDKAPTDPHQAEEQDENYKEDVVIELPSVDIDNMEENQDMIHLSLEDTSHPFIQLHQQDIEDLFRGVNDIITFNITMDEYTYVIVGVAEVDREEIGGVHILDYQIDGDILTVVYETRKNSEQYVDIVELPKHTGVIITRGK